MKKTNNLSDEQLKQLIEQSKANIEVPEPTNWEQVHAEVLKQVKKKRRWLTLKQIASISAAAVLISFFINNNSATEVSAQFTNFFKVLKNEATLIFLSEARDQENGANKSSLSEGEGSAILINNEEIKLALNELEYTPAFPKYLPNGYDVDQVYLEDTDLDKSLSIILINDSDKFISISFRRFEDQYTLIRDPNLAQSSYQDHNIGKYVGIMVETKKNGYTVDWFDDKNIKTTIRTNLDKFEIVKILDYYY